MGESVTESTYKGNMSCGNCGLDRAWMIPVGTTVEDFISGNSPVCSACGCAAMSKKVVS